jgi:drug/metabolite transporter (DMT)-like permease
MALTRGELSVVAVIGSLYPIGTVLLARVLLGERMRRIQLAGVLAAFVGVALVTAGTA